MIGNLLDRSELTKNSTARESPFHAVHFGTLGCCGSYVSSRIQQESPAPKGKARGEIRGETIALTAALC